MGKGYIRADGHQVGSILVEPETTGGKGEKLPTNFPHFCSNICRVSTENAASVNRIQRVACVTTSCRPDLKSRILLALQK